MLDPCVHHETNLSLGILPGHVDGLQWKLLPAGQPIGCHNEAQSFRRVDLELGIVQFQNHLTPVQVGKLNMGMEI